MKTPAPGRTCGVVLVLLSLATLQTLRAQKVAGVHGFLCVCT